MQLGPRDNYLPEQFVPCTRQRVYKVPQMGVWLENTGEDRGLTQILGNCLVGSEGRKQMDFFVMRELVKVCFAQSNQQ